MDIKIGMRIKELRKRTNTTQEQLAEALGVTNQAVSKWESENGYPDITYILPIANYFNVTADYLLGNALPNLNKADDKKMHVCSFCNKNNMQVNSLIAGPNVNICSECVYICVDVLSDTPNG